MAAKGSGFSVSTRAAVEAVDISDRVAELAGESGVESGFCHVMVLHSTAAVVVNETADPNIGRDVAAALDRAVPERGDWLHDRIDDNAAAHIKASILGPSETIPVQGGELLLGTWQGIWLIDFDGPRTRQVSVRFVSDAGDA